jgi:alkylation response protein AidB-like acyl-CoA dehydrogenase
LAPDSHARAFLIGGDVMDFSLAPAETQWRDLVRAFMDEHVRPRVPDYDAQQRAGQRWKVLPVIEELKDKARGEGLWNLFMPPSHGATPVDDSFDFDGPALTNLQYAFCAEEMGRVGWASEVFNCSAPDTGNMEVLHRYGSREQKDAWLKPLMNGEIRSAFLMTEPGVASSDATNIECRIEMRGNEYVINGRKWWSSGAGDPRCKVAVLMGKTDPAADKHKQQSMILVPLDAPGVKVLRHLTVYGYDDAPHGHMEIALEDVRVPPSNMLLGEGRGFEIAQGRLGPGRIHHCMRTIGAAEQALDAMVERLMSRTAFGKTLAEQGVWEERVANARIEIEMTRLLCLKAADMMDRAGNKAAQGEIAMIKVAAPNMALRVIDDAIQAFGAAGVSDDVGLAGAYASIRTLRLADGPDEVHRRAIARLEFKKHR